MSTLSNGNTRWAKMAEYSIWLFALGYFTCYVPLSAMTKVVTKGLVSSVEPLAGVSILPVSTAVSVIGMLTFITAMGWWKHARHSKILGMNLPRPELWTFLSGLSTAVIIATTLLAYTFDNLSIVFAMLLMRGGVLIIARVVDLVTGRQVHWYSQVALVLAIGALAVSMLDSDGLIIPALAAFDIGLYLAAYFVRLNFMSRRAKSEDPNVNLKYFVEEQMVASPFLLIVLVTFGLVSAPSTETIGGLVRIGIVDIWSSPMVLLMVASIGLASQGAGIFGSLIFLDKRENTYCVPVNRASSIMAGVLATVGLMVFFDQNGPGVSKLIGAGMIILAILFLTVPPSLAKAKKARAALATTGSSEDADT